MARKSLVKTLAYLFLITYTVFFCSIVVTVVWNFQQQATRLDVLSINEVAVDVQREAVDRIIIYGNPDRSI